MSSSAGHATGDVLGTDECFTGVELDKGLVKSFPDTLVAKLASSVIGKKEGWDKLVETFQADHPYLAKAQIKRKIFEISSRSAHPKGHGALRWVLKPEFKDSLQSVVEEVVWTPRKVRVPKPVGPSITPVDVSEAIKLASNNLSDVEAPRFICRAWDLLLRTVYPWSVLWPRLLAAGWQNAETRNFSLSAYVLVPGWAVDRYEAAGNNPLNLSKNRDYFLDQDAVRAYILKFGAAETQIPPSPEKRARRTAAQAPTVAVDSAASISSDPSSLNVLEDPLYLAAMKDIVDRKVAAMQAQALKRKAELEARGNLDGDENEGDDLDCDGTAELGSRDSKSPRLDLSDSSPSENSSDKENRSPFQAHTGSLRIPEGSLKPLNSGAVLAEIFSASTEVDKSLESDAIFISDQDD
jgi:hypothetical protein